MSTAQFYSPGHADSDLNRYLGFTYPEIGPDGVVARQDPTQCGRDGERSDRVDSRALLAVTDHVMGLALHAALALKAPLATVELKMEHLAPLEPGPVFIRTLAAPLSSHLAFVTARLDQGDARRTVGYASARFMVGAWPGGGAAAFPPPLDTPVDPSGIVDFSSFAGLPAADDPAVAFEIMARERLVGARAVPAFHGGIVGAGLQTVAINLARRERGADARLVSLSIDYGRAALATEPIKLEARVIRGGRRSLRILATARQGDDRVVSEAQALFVVEGA